jgi:hypothetical protein
LKTKRARAAARAVTSTLALTPQQALWLELMPFYVREAWLLDERRLKDGSCTDDVVYFIPRADEVFDSAKPLAQPPDRLPPP